MLDFTIKTDENEKEYLETSITGKAILTISQLNKGTAFSEQERDIFDLRGKLPINVESLEAQVKRAYLQYEAFEEQINRNVHLNYLLNTNQVLFYRLVQTHLREMLPTIYTPIVGNAVKVFNKKFTNPRGLYICYEDRDRIDEILDNRSNPEIDIIVVSDGEGVLGIGDQGVGGMAIPVAKLMVYTAIGGINPLNTLPILLDAGTNNHELLNDPLYLGWRHERIRGKEYDKFINKFIDALKRKLPHVFLHWEDFGRTNAYSNLIKYREKICSFNDDLQGTGVVAKAAVIGASKLINKKLSTHRIVVYGAGTAGMGITNMLADALTKDGVNNTEVHKLFWLIDREGLITQHCKDVTTAQQPYVRTTDETAHWQVTDKSHITLLETIQHVKPTILIGCSAQPSAFTQEIVETMSSFVERPIIFPLSNPNDCAEASPSDIIHWSKGKALIATGSPFDDVNYKNEIFPLSQCNNYLAFPGIGLGVIAVKAQSVSDNMLEAASLALSQYASDKEHRLLPDISRAREASRIVAIAVAKKAIEEGLAPKPHHTIEELVDKKIWKPHYIPYRLRK